MNILSALGGFHLTIIRGVSDELSVSALIELERRLNSPIFEQLKIFNLFHVKSLEFLFTTRKTYSFDNLFRMNV